LVNQLSHGRKAADEANGAFGGTLIRLVRVAASLTLALSFVSGVPFSGAAVADIIYQNDTTYDLTGSSDVYIGDYGLTGPSATYVIDASATFSTSGTFDVMLFNTNGGPSGPDLFYVNGICNSTPTFYWNDYNSCGSPFSVAAPATTNDGNLHQYVVVLNSVGDTSQLYFDGVSVGTAAYYAPENNLTLGGDSAGFDWTGTISGVTIYDTALTSAQVADLPSPGGQQPVPEPLSLGLFGVGLAGIGAIRRRRYFSPG
jgi:hypothetical protein